MLAFVVTIKSKAVTRDWATYSVLVNRTLRCLTQQTSPAYRVLAVHEDLPISPLTHPRVDYVHTSLAVPRDRAGKENDKALRLMAGIEAAQRYRPTHLMPVDSDDLVSTRLAAFVAAQPEVIGWASMKGYVWPANWPVVFRQDTNFPDLCGSALIVRADLIGQFLRQDPIAFVDGLVMPPGATWYDHQKLVLDDGQPLGALPFRSTIYSVLHGENIRATTDLVGSRTRTPGAAIGFARRLYERKPAPFTRRLRTEFGLS